MYMPKNWTATQAEKLLFKQSPDPTRNSKYNLYTGVFEFSLPTPQKQYTLEEEPILPEKMSKCIEVSK